jgi:hypothetical protein
MNFLIALSLALSAAQAPAPAQPSSPAVAEARQWAALIDQGRYPDSWTRGGTILKAQVTAAALQAAIEPVRKALGAVVSRTLKSETPTSSLPGAPPGDYDLIQFDTAFTGKTGAIETIVLAHEPSGWKVDGWAIR